MSISGLKWFVFEKVSVVLQHGHKAIAYLSTRVRRPGGSSDLEDALELHRTPQHVLEPLHCSEMRMDGPNDFCVLIRFEEAERPSLVDFVLVLHSWMLRMNLRSRLLPCHRAMQPEMVVTLEQSSKAREP